MNLATAPSASSTQSQFEELIIAGAVIIIVAIVTVVLGLRKLKTGKHLSDVNTG